MSREAFGHLRAIFRDGALGTLSDAQLIDRFLAQRDAAAESAFAALIERHGPMVFGVCRRALGDSHAAEDAVQATFLVLARKAARLSRRERLGNWLFGVASRISRDLRRSEASRSARERQPERLRRAALGTEPADGPDGVVLEELRAVLDEELARLPDRYRAAVVLCELEGLSRPDAARALDVPEGTLSSRLARAKAILRDRLARRGLGPSAMLLAVVLGEEARAAVVPAALVEPVARAAARFAAGGSVAGVVSIPVVTLTEGALQSMWIAKLKGAAIGLATLGFVAAGTALGQFGTRTSATGTGLDRVEEAPVVVEQLRKTDPLVESRPGEADRMQSLEDKLDRVLAALEGRMVSGTAPNPVVAREAMTGRAPSPGRADLVRSSPSVNDRLEELDHRLTRLEKQFARLEKQFAAIQEQPRLETTTRPAGPASTEPPATDSRARSEDVSTPAPRRSAR